MTKKLSVATIKAHSSDYPERLTTIDGPPKQLHYIGDLAGALARSCLAIVGSRKVSAYGKGITLKLAKEAAEQGITVISGLALGIDGLAHQGALEARGKTIAVLPCGLDRIYPASHRDLAERILLAGGALVTEYPFETQPYKTNFLERNRIIAGLSDAVLITEAAIRSGSISTANHALNQGRTVFAVPGNITSELSAGTNNLIKAGALPVTELSDILSAMDIIPAKRGADVFGDTEEETAILRLISGGTTDSSELLIHSKLSAPLFNQTLTMLEISGKIRPLGAGKWSIS